MVFMQRKFIKLNINDLCTFLCMCYIIQYKFQNTKTKEHDYRLYFLLFWAINRAICTCTCHTHCNPVTLHPRVTLYPWTRKLVAPSSSSPAPSSNSKPHEHYKPLGWHLMRISLCSVQRTFARYSKFIYSHIPITTTISTTAKEKNKNFIVAIESSILSTVSPSDDHEGE